MEAVSVEESEGPRPCCCCCAAVAAAAAHWGTGRRPPLLLRWTGKNAEPPSLPPPPTGPGWDVGAVGAVDGGCCGGCDGRGGTGTGRRRATAGAAGRGWSAKDGPSEIRSDSPGRCDGAAADPSAGGPIVPLVSLRMKAGLASMPSGDPPAAAATAGLGEPWRLPTTLPPPSVLPLWCREPSIPPLPSPLPPSPGGWPSSPVESSMASRFCGALMREGGEWDIQSPNPTPNAHAGLKHESTHLDWRRHGRGRRLRGLDRDGRERGDGRSLRRYTVAVLELPPVLPVDHPPVRRRGHAAIGPVAARDAAAARQGGPGHIHGGRGGGAATGVIDSGGRRCRCWPLLGRLRLSRRRLHHRRPMGTPVVGPPPARLDRRWSQWRLLPPSSRSGASLPYVRG